MDKIENKIFQDLDKKKISYSIFNHPPSPTVSDSRKIRANIPGEKTKCLFLKDENSKYYLVALQAEKRLDVKTLKDTLNLKSLSFSNESDLRDELKTTPGSVSILGLIFSKNITLILDSDLYRSESLTFHPNINSQSILLDNKNLKKFLETLDNKINILKL